MNKLEVKDILKDNKLPEGWVKTILADPNFFKTIGSGIYPFKGTRLYLSTSSIEGTKIISIEEIITYKKRPSRANMQPRKGLVAFAKMRSTLKVLLVNDELEKNYILSTGFSLIESKLSPNYLFQYFLSFLFNHQKNILAEGTTQEAISNDDFEKIFIILPSSFLEQQKIAEILETVDDTIEKTDAIIEKYKRIKQGLMQDLLTIGITAFEFEKDKLIADVKKVFDSGDHRFGREENLVSHLSRHLENFFPEWDVDNEVEKNNERQRPDIIVHKRGMDKNLFAIEVKKNENLNAIKLDIEKLEDVMLGDYHYEDAVFIGFYIENFEAVFKLSEKVNFILVPKNGEIKVKSHVRRFKDSPLGKIPEEWEVVKLGEVATILLSNVDKKIFPQEIKVKLCNYLEVYKHDYIFKNVNFSIGSVNIREYQKFRVDKGDVIITKDSEEFDDIAKSAYVEDEIEDLICGYHLCLIKPKINIIAGQYLAMVLWFEKYNKQFQNKANGITRFGISKETIENALLPLPSLPEQRRIVSILSQTDEAIEKEQRYKEKLERIKQGLMEDLLTGEVRTNYLIKEGVESV